MQQQRGAGGGLGCAAGSTFGCLAEEMHFPLRLCELAPPLARLKAPPLPFYHF